jgi:uncharacterized membrane protein
VTVNHKAPARAQNRIDVVDLGRGAVMALMALDHTRTFFTNVPYDPTDLTRTFPALFFTRWISHFAHRSSSSSRAAAPTSWQPAGDPGPSPGFS